jgi:regulatory protein
MDKITEIRITPGRQPRAKIYINGKPALAVSPETVARQHLASGNEIQPSAVDALIKADLLQNCRSAAERFLSYRPRSEAELRQRLVQRNFPSDVVDATVEALKEIGLVNDADFARYWKENREVFRPRSRLITARELRQKGVDKDVIDATVGTLDDAAGAYAVAVKKSRSMASLDYATFRRRISGFLSRRGFDFEITRQTTERLWRELNANKSGK